MDEIELLQEFRAELPGIRIEKRQAARAALMAQVESSKRPPRRSRAPFRGGRRTRLLLAGVGLVAILVALPILLFGGHGEVQPAVGQVLREAAAVADSQEAEAPPGPGQYFYTRTREAYLSSVGYSPRCKTHPCDREHPWEATDEWSVLSPREREAWTAPDGTMKFRVTSEKPEFLSAAQRAGWVAAGSPPLTFGQVEEESMQGNRFLDTSDLPTDPAPLRKLIEERKVPGVGGPPGEAETFVLIGDLLRNTWLPSDFRAALYRVVAELPGVELLGDVEDPVGRTGIGVAYTDAKRGTRHELIFNPETAALLGEREVVAGTRPESFTFGLPAGTEIGSASYLESGVVDSTKSRPLAG